MSDTTEAFFARLGERGYEPLLHNVAGVIHWDIENAGNWFVIVKYGALNVSRDTPGADCVLACSEGDFDRMVLGKQNPTTLFMQGKMNITGDLVLAQMFQRLLPEASLPGGKRG